MYKKHNQFFYLNSVISKPQKKEKRSQRKEIWVYNETSFFRFRKDRQKNVIRDLTTFFKLSILLVGLVYNLT